MLAQLPTHAVKAVILNHEGAVLLLQRNPATHDGESNWDLPGGLVEEGENPVEALKREVAEELGVTIKMLEEAATWQFLRSKDNQHVHVQNYLCEITNGDIRLSDEHIQYQWVSPELLSSYPVKHGSLYAALANLPRPIATVEPYLTDLTDVGPTKPLGYLPLQTLRGYHIDLQQLEATLLARGLSVLRTDPTESHIRSGALYAYHEPSLRALLERSARVLTVAAWPTEPTAFVQAVDTLTAPRDTELYELVAEAFGDGETSQRG